MTHFAALDIRLADDYLTIGPVALVPRGSSVNEITRVLGPPDRILPMHYNNLFVNTLYLYDQLGIRFWAKAEVVSELQIVFETEERETFPVNSFVGPLQYKSYTLLPPVAGSTFMDNKLSGFVQDLERLQYDRVVYEAKTLKIKYTALVSKRTGDLQYLSIS